MEMLIHLLVAVLEAEAEQPVAHLDHVLHFGLCVFRFLDLKSEVSPRHWLKPTRYTEFLLVVEQT